MANHPSAAKRARQALVRRNRNRSTMSAVRTAIKKVETAVAGKNTDTARSALNEATSLISRAAGKGVLHKNNAAHKVSRLTLLVNALG
ncbi:MAG: 30S ribosomal protein S20 [Nitrospirota bacterium]|nr:30S ribosomal protein S20 [Nitrospirota bacterium]